MDNRECAAWIRSLLTVSNWKEHLKSDCILFQLAGLNALSIAFDWMHNAYLGWLQYFYGSVLFFLVYHILPHDPLTNLIDTVAPFIKEYQKSNEVLQKYRPGLSKLTMFEKKNRSQDFEGELQTSGKPQPIRQLDQVHKIKCSFHVVECFGYVVTHPVVGSTVI